jgi:hypothetical protein
MSTPAATMTNQSSCIGTIRDHLARRRRRAKF